MRLNTPVAIDCEAVTMDLNGVTINEDVALDQGQMNVESFGITSERSCQIGCCNARQTALPSRLASQYPYSIMISSRNEASLEFATLSASRVIFFW
jgi:hypothetical protein